MNLDPLIKFIFWTTAIHYALLVCGVLWFVSARGFELVRHRIGK